MFTRVLSLFVIVILALPAEARDHFPSGSSDLEIYRHGVQQRLIEDNVKKDITRRIAHAFNKNDADTSSVWYRTELGLSDEGLQDQWNSIINDGSYFHIALPAKKITRKSIKANIAEVIVTISENPEHNSIGRVFSKLRDGEVRAYRIDGLNMINIYCFDKALQYLPVHYTAIHDKYSDEAYKNSGVQCSGSLQQKMSKKSRK